MKSVSRRGAVQGMIGKSAAEHTLRHAGHQLQALGYEVPDLVGHVKKMTLDNEDVVKRYIIAKTSEEKNFMFTFTRMKNPLVKVSGSCIMF
jgi:hypothetical protein